MDENEDDARLAEDLRNVGEELRAVRSGGPTRTPACPAPPAMAWLLHHGPSEEQAEHIEGCPFCFGVITRAASLDEVVARAASWPDPVRARFDALRAGAAPTVESPSPGAEVIEFPRFDRLLAVAAAEPGADGCHAHQPVADRFRHRATGTTIERRTEGGRRVMLDLGLPASGAASHRLAQVVVLSGGGQEPGPRVTYLLPVRAVGPTEPLTARVHLDAVDEWLETQVVLPLVAAEEIEQFDPETIERSVVAALEYRPSVESWRVIADLLPDQSRARSIIRAVLRAEATPR